MGSFFKEAYLLEKLFHFLQAILEILYVSSDKRNAD